MPALVDPAGTTRKGASPMTVLVVGLPRTAAAMVTPPFSASAHRATANDLRRAGSLDGTLVLSLDDRIDICADAVDLQRAVAGISAVLLRNARSRPAASCDDIEVRSGAAAVEYVLSLTAGLTSTTTAITQIAARLRSALEVGTAFGTAGVTLTDLVKRALLIGERIRAQACDDPTVAAELVQTELKAHRSSHGRRSAAPLVDALHRRARAVVVEELARLDRRVPVLSDQQRDVVHETVQQVVSTILRPATARLTTLASTSSGVHYEAAVRTLFDLDPTPLIERNTVHGVTPFAHPDSGLRA